MKKAFILSAVIAISALLLSSFQAFAQDTETKSVKYPPNLKAIEKVVNKDRARYDSLTESFLKMDSTTVFTPEEVAIIYYGYAFTSHYAPYGNYDNIRELIQKEDLEKAKAEALEAQINNPVSLELLYDLFIIADRTKDKELFKNITLRMQTILFHISKSGRGTEDSPMYVINVTDEYIFLNFAGVGQILGQSLVNTPSGQCDKMDFKLEDDNENTYTFYFNVDLPLSHLNKLFD
ncbi:MAG: DUF4919 domain-containing protein [Bacteroidales bacterium]|nr:DUF4919 domain-containing protein [Bacteroidales bacterium]